MTEDDLAIGGYYRHKKTGGTYQLLMFATIEATMTPAVVYAARAKDGVHSWVRPVAEFCDGRFEPVDMTVKMKVCGSSFFRCAAGTVSVRAPASSMPVVSASAVPSRAIRNSGSGARANRKHEGEDHECKSAVRSRASGIRP